MEGRGTEEQHTEMPVLPHNGLLMLLSYNPNLTEMQLILRHDGDGYSADQSAFACTCMNRLLSTQPIQPWESSEMVLLLLQLDCSIN